MICLSGCGPARPDRAERAARPGKMAHGPDHGPHPRPAARWWPGPVGPWPDVARPVPCRPDPLYIYNSKSTLFEVINNFILYDRV